MLTEADLSQFYGTQAYHWWSILFRNMFLSDGAKYVAEQAGAYWLMDAIASHQPKALKYEQLREIQFWTLKVVGRSAVLTCVTDSGRPPVIKQEIEYTDFPLSEIKLYVAPCEGGYLIFLPSEY